MRVMVLHTPKGGSGKSTLARELAVTSDAAGLRVALADLDPQGTTRGWYRRREARTPALVRFDPAATAEDLTEAIDLLVVDTPPATPPFLPALLRRADVVLVPVRPTPDDLLAAAPIARSLAGKGAWAFVLCQVPPRTRFLASAIRQLAALGKVAPAHLTFRADFPAAAITGQATVEFTETKAAEEVGQLWAYVAHELLGEVDAAAEG